MNIIPNSICQGIGEASIEQKIQPWIAEAQSWFNRCISPEVFISSDELKRSADIIIQCRALYNAAPALDVTMHPNGLAVVNTDSLAPASAERSREFRQAIMKQMFNEIEDLITTLSDIEEWRQSQPAKTIWLASVFNTPYDICMAALCDYNWDDMEAAVASLRQIEDFDATTVWAPEMLQKLRETKAEGILAALKSLVKRVVRARMMELKSKFKDPYARAHRLTEISRAQQQYINICRDNRDLTELWHKSNTARIYNQIIFKNEKSAPGYFF